MAQHDAARQIGMLRTAFPRELVPQDTVGLYVLKLADIDGELLAATVSRLIEDSKFFPTIAEIRKMAAKIAGLLPPTAAEAIALVRRADRREQVYRRDGSFAYEERFWDWPEDAAPALIELCCITLQLAGDPVHKGTGEDHFAWDAGFRQAYESVTDKAVIGMLADLSAARIAEAPARRQLTP